MTHHNDAFLDAPITGTTAETRHAARLQCAGHEADQPREQTKRLLQMLGLAPYEDETPRKYRDRHLSRRKP